MKYAVSVKEKKQRCPRRHERLWEFGKGGGVVYWCLDCGGISLKNIPKGTRRLWFYPGSTNDRFEKDVEIWNKIVNIIDEMHNNSCRI